MPALRLMAIDADDLRILSAYCQDAVTRVEELQFLATEKRFILPMNRFVWEQAVEPPRQGFFRRAVPPTFERRRAVLHFDQVLGAKRLGPAFSDPQAVLSLLDIRFLPGDAPSGTVELVFAAGSAIRLDVEVIEAQLTDVGGAWATAARPDHDRPD